MSFNFPQDLVLEDEQVLLRPLQETDVDNLLKISLNEPETWEYSLVKGNGKENLINYIHWAVEARGSKMEFPFIVFDKRTGKYAGSTRFYGINQDFKTLLLGFTWYGKQFRGTGLNKHCKFLLLQYAFEELGVERVEFRADNKNVISIAAMKSIGCKEEGVLRSHMPTFNSDIRRDTIILSIVSSEWFDGVKANLIKSL